MNGAKPPTRVALTVAMFVEAQAVLERFAPDAPIVIRGDTPCYQLGFHSGIDLVLAVIGKGQKEAREFCERLCIDWQPKLIVSIGLAFGTDSCKQEFGDVLISNAVHAYYPPSVKSGGLVNSPVDCITVNSQLLSVVRAFLLERDADLTLPSVHIGGVLSVSRMISYRDELLAMYDENIVGGEMESFSIALAADRHNVDWIVVRGIADFSDANKDNKYQPLAAKNAAQIVYTVIPLLATWYGATHEVNTLGTTPQ